MASRDMEAAGAREAPDRRAAIEAIGRELGPDVLAKCMALYRAEQGAFVAGERRVADLAYGDHLRQRIDLYQPEARSPAPRPVLLFVHGGGFVRGEKRSDEHPFGASVGRFAARHGLLGAVMGYRLAPEFRWPSGGEDVAAAVAWLVANVAEYGGDPARIVLLGTSAGSVHVATFLKRVGRSAPVKGAVLLSGLYGATAHERFDDNYFGPAARDDIATIDTIASAPVPLYLACAEFDPLRFQREWLAVLTRYAELQGRLPPSRVVRGHNHYTLAMHLGSSDEAFSNEILAFVRDVARDPGQ